MRQHEVFETTRYSLWRRGERRMGRARLLYLEVRDRYSRFRYKSERQTVAVMAQAFERILRHYPGLQFDSPRNLIRKAIYLPKSMRMWAQNIPGGLATYQIQNPEVKRLNTGERIGFVTRKFFRHSTDGIGLRSRAYAMSWWLYEHVTHKRRLHWLSLAAGSGQPTYDAIELYDIQPEVYLADLSEDALEFAQVLGDNRGLDMSRVHVDVCDITDQTSLKYILKNAKPDVVDMMGVIEYLPDETVVMILKTLSKNLAKGSVMCFTNMRPEHPHLHTYRRGLGWPGATVRSVDAVLELIKKAGISLERVEVLLPSDRVHAVYCLKF